MIYTNDHKFTKCKSEQEFKMSYLKEIANPAYYRFCIETEETVQGFPDVMEINRETSECCFMEFKFTKTGKIKFQPSQPAFYKAHWELNIVIVAYNAKTKCLHVFQKDRLLSKNNRYCLNENGEVDLCSVEGAEV